MSTIVTFHVRFLVLSSEDTELRSPPEAIIRQTQERMMRQRGNLKALARICDFHLSFFPGTSAHFIWLFETPSSQCTTASKQTMATHQEGMFSHYFSWHHRIKVCGPSSDYFQAFNWCEIRLSQAVPLFSLGRLIPEKIYWLWCVTLSLSIKSYDYMAGLSYWSLYCRY